MSGTGAPGRAAGPVIPAQAAGKGAGTAPRDGSRGRRPGRRRRVVLVAAVVVLVAAGVAGAALAGGFRGSPGSPGSKTGSGYGAPTAVVRRETLVSQTSVDATLGFAGSYTVAGKGGGTLTWLPPAGRVIRQGGVLYRVDNGVPVVLLYGRVPAWRALKEGMTGQDVTQLNHDLVALGYADSGYIAALGWDYFSWETKYGLQQLQLAVGMTTPAGAATGSLALGQAVFLPQAIRVTGDAASLGGPASGTILSATSARRVVTISLDASQQTEVKKGDKVTVTLPDGTATPGVITSVGKVASGSGSSAKVTVQVRLRHPKAAGGLDQAPVTVAITTARVRDVLVVPVAALLARPGGYAVEVATSRGHHRLVKVIPGLFDDTAGLVQVSGSGLAAGQQVVVPAL